MAHFAKLDATCTVIQVLCGSDEDEGKELELCARTGDTYRQTSYNTYGGVHTLGGAPFRKNYAGIGYTYDESRDAFIPPKPFDSWTLNETSCLWEAPVAYPDDGEVYTWNEENQNWDLVDGTN